MSECTDCGKENAPVLKVCRVCELIDKDASKKMCKYCLSCDAFMCDACEHDFIKRSKAFFVNIIS